MKNRLHHLVTFFPILSAALMILLGHHSAAAEAEFRAVDIFIDSKGQPLAAYQLDWKIASGQAKIVGIEGGDHAAFKEPPFYDPRAMQKDRAILASFKVAESEKLPKGRLRVATIHLQVPNGKPCKYSIQRAAAVDNNGERISIEASSQERTTQ